MINPSQEWNNVSEDDKMVIKMYFDVNATGTSNVLVAPLAPKIKFLLNFLWNTIIPRRGGRDKVSSYELIVVYNWLEGRRIDLPSLVFHRVIQTSVSLTKEKFSTTLDLPYGVWISRLLEIKRVLAPESYGIIPRDGKCEKYLKLMGFGTVEDGVSTPKGNSAGLSETFKATMEAKLDSFMTSIGEKLETQATVLASVVSGLGHGSPNGAMMNDDVVTWMNGVESRISKMERSLVTVRDEVFNHGRRMDFLVSQGGALVKDGKIMRDEVATTLEATRALSLKVLNFDTCLTTQATHVKSCFDRLDSLEYRTRPGYVDPTKIRRS